jgi:hypothetical protein
MKKFDYIQWLVWLSFIFSLLISSTCIERNNPWDPIHGCPSDFRKEIQEQSLSVFDSFKNDAQQNLNLLYEQYSIIDSLNKRNDSVRSVFKLVQKKLDSTYAINQKIDSLNSIDCKNLASKIKADTFPSLTFFSDTVYIQDFRDSMSTDSMQTILRIIQDNSQCRPHGVYSTKSQDSIINSFVRLNSRADSLIGLIQKFNSSITDTNAQVIAQKNHAIELYNISVNKYNDSVVKAMVYCGVSWHSDAEEITKIARSLQPGDTLSIDSGTYSSVQIKFSKEGDSTKPILVQGSPFLNTILLEPDFSISESNNIILKNISIRNAKERGLNIEGNSSNIKIENCSFIKSNKSGLEVLNSFVSVNNCVFSENNINGIYCNGPGAEIKIDNSLIIKNHGYGVSCNTSHIIISQTTISENNINGIYCNGPGAEIKIDNSLIIKNHGHGVSCNNSQMIISQTTISDNTLSGVYIINQKPYISINNSIITYNTHFGLERESPEVESDINIFNSNFFANTSGNFKGDSTRIILDHFFKNLDPDYANRDQNDYTVRNSELFNLGYNPRN